MKPFLRKQQSNQEPLLEIEFDRDDVNGIESAKLSSLQQLGGYNVPFQAGGTLPFLLRSPDTDTITGPFSYAERQCATTYKFNDHYELGDIVESGDF
jgi:hypothetical protein